MFYPERIERIRFLVHESMKETVVKRLHELGAVQVTDYREKLSKKEWSELLDAHPVSPAVRKVTTQLMAVNRLLDVFSLVDPEEEEGFLKKLFAPSPPEKIPVEDISGEKLFEEVSSAASTVEAAVSDPLESLEKMEVKKSELAVQQELFERIQSIDVPLEALGEGSFVNAIMGITPKKDFSPLRAEIDEATNSMFFFSETSISETESCMLVICLVPDTDEISGCLRKWDIERIVPGDFKVTPAEAIVEIDKRIRALDEEQKKCREKISSAANRWRSRLKSLRELLLIERERVEVYSGFARTEFVIAIEGWVIQKKSGEVASEIERCCDGLAVAKVTEPDEPVEKLPVALDNPGILKHFELLTKLYSQPQYDEIDPTVLIFPSFLFFFGLMITDAMYGLMCLLLGIFILRGGGKYYPLYNSAGMLLTLGGAATVVLGSLTGGWFGNFATDYLGMEFLNSLVVINPMVDVSQFLLFAIGVGLLHLNLGIVVGIIKDVRRNNTPEALKNIWIFFVEIALICYYFKANTAALIFVVPALLLLLYSQKGMALFGVTGLLGDTLSYARLMALGLVSFGLAVAINALAKMVLGISYIGWLFAILIFIGGHLFSFVLNLMGAFAHGIRLHFVEFFGKFYSGGGDEFEPFRIKREITEKSA